MNANPSTIELPENGYYVADDIQVGELDGDGEMEIVIKREPYDGANQGGWHNGTTLLEAYKLDGTFLWRIDLGVNIVRALIILLIYCTILMVMDCVKSLSVLPKVLSLQMER